MRPMHAALAAVISLLTACGSTVDGSAVPAARVDPSSTPQNAVASMTVTADQLAGLALSQAQLEQIVGGPLHDVDIPPTQHTIYLPPAGLTEAACASWTEIGQSTTYAGTGYIDSWGMSRSSAAVRPGVDPSRRFGGQFLTVYPSSNVAKSALSVVATALGRCQQQQFAFGTETASWFTDKPVFDNPTLLTAYMFELDGGEYACAIDFSAKANLVAEGVACSNKRVVRVAARAIVAAIAAKLPA